MTCVVIAVFIPLALAELRASALAAGAGSPYDFITPNAFQEPGERGAVLFIGERVSVNALWPGFILPTWICPILRDNLPTRASSKMRREKKLMERTSRSQRIGRECLDNKSYRKCTSFIADAIVQQYSLFSSRTQYPES